MGAKTARKVTKRDMKEAVRHCIRPCRFCGKKEFLDGACRHCTPTWIKDEIMTAIDFYCAYRRKHPFTDVNQSESSATSPPTDALTFDFDNNFKI